MVSKLSFARLVLISSVTSSLCYVAVRVLRRVMCNPPGIPSPPVPALANSGFFDRYIRRFILQHLYILNQHETLFQLLHWARMFDYKPFLIRMCLRRHIVISCPADIEEILLHQEYKFCKKTGYDLLRKFIGNGLLPMGNKDKHTEHRSIFAPIFGRSNLIGLSNELIRPHALRLLGTFFGLLLSVGEGGLVTLNLSEYVNRMVLSIIGEAVFRASPEETATVLALFSTMVDFKEENYFIPCFRTPSQRDAEKQMTEIINSLFQRSGEWSKAPHHRIVLDALLEELHVHFDKRDVIHHLMTFLFAGYDTTSTAIEFLSVLLSRNVRAQDKLFEELEALMPVPGVCPLTEDLLSCEYLLAVYREALRLYPSAPLIYRDAESAARLPAADVTVPKGAVCVLNIFGAQRCAAVYGPDADAFRPERWLGAEGDALRRRGGRCAFMPFSVGRRRCIGQDYGTYEVLLVTALLFRHMRFSAAGAFPRTMFQFTLRSPDPFRVGITLREGISQETLKNSVRAFNAASADISS